MIEKEQLSIEETLKEFRNILLGQKIEVFTDHNNIIYETIGISSQSVKLCKSLMKEFGVTLLYIKGEANIVSNDFRRISIVHNSHKLADTTLEEDTCELLCLDYLFISDNTDCL